MHIFLRCTWNNLDEPETKPQNNPQGTSKDQKQTKYDFKHNDIKLETNRREIKEIEKYV